MSSNDQKCGSPGLTLTTESELEETSTHDEGNMHKKKTPHVLAGSQIENPEPLSLLAESQRLQLEMLRNEMVREVLI